MALRHHHVDSRPFHQQADSLLYVFASNNLKGIEIMCRNIKMLHNFKPPATEEEIRASSLQFVRKLSGFNKPSKANELAFNRAVDQVAHQQHGALMPRHPA